MDFRGINDGIWVTQANSAKVKTCSIKRLVLRGFQTSTRPVLSLFASQCRWFSARWKPTSCPDAVRGFLLAEAVLKYFTMGLVRAKQYNTVYNLISGFWVQVRDLWQRNVKVVGVWLYFWPHTYIISHKEATKFIEFTCDYKSGYEILAKLQYSLVCTIM